MTRTVLVTAATGTVGRHIVRGLSEDEFEGDVAVRTGTRDPDAARERFGDLGDPIEFDFARPETWGRALEGVDGLFLVRPPGVAVRDVTAFVDAAARVGVEHVAYLSTLGADRNVLIPHHRIERHVERSGAAYTLLRASFFAQNLHEVHREDIVERDEIFVPAGSGKTSFVDARDVGAVAARTLAEPSEHRNVAYDLTGPTALDYDEVAAAFTRTLDRKIVYADPSIPSFVARTRSRGVPIGYALLMVGIYTTARLGLADRVTDDVERVLDRPPRSLEAYVTDYADRFRRNGSVDESAADGETGSGRVAPANPPPDRLVRLANPLLTLALRSPLHRLVSDSLLLLTVTGRKTGTEYTFPVGYEQFGETVYVTSHGTNWWKNLRNGGQRVSVLLRGTERTGRAEVFEDDEIVAEYLRGYVRRNGIDADRRVVLRIRGDSLPDERALRNAVDHVVLVRIDLGAAR